MLDPHLLRSDLEGVARGLARRGLTLDTAHIETLERERKTLQTRTEELKAERNRKSKAIGAAKSRGESAEAIMAEVGELGQTLADHEARLEAVLAELKEFAFGTPNLPHPSVPEGDDEDANIEMRRWGTPPEFDFEVRDHVALGERLGAMSFEDAAKLAKSRFAVLKGPLARLHRALIQFMLDVHTSEHGYEELYVPYLVNAESMRGTGQLPTCSTSRTRTCISSPPPRSRSPTSRGIRSSMRRICR